MLTLMVTRSKTMSLTKRSTSGKDYDTVVDNRPKEIEFQGKTYELVPAGNYKVGQVDEQGHWTGDDATTGKVIEGDKNVTYVYKLKEDPTNLKKVTSSSLT